MERHAGRPGCHRRAHRIEQVVEAALKPKRVQLVVVCRSFDPAIDFPEPYEHTDLLNNWRERLSRIGVFQWRT
jgi:hypothetical protein